jgi:hypothetical protein
MAVVRTFHNSVAIDRECMRRATRRFAPAVAESLTSGPGSNGNHQKKGRPEDAYVQTARISCTDLHDVSS